MAEEATTTTKVNDVPKWAWPIAIALILILVAGLIIGSYFSKDSGKNKTNASQATVSSHQDKKETVPEATKTETENEGIREEKFLIFVLLGAILLGIAFIPKLPSAKLLGGIGALLLLFGLIMAATLWTWPELGKENKKPQIPAAAHHAPATASEGTRLPDGAKFVKKLAPGEKIYLTRTSMDAPPPERWARNIRGEVYKVANWPSDEKTFFTENTWPAKAEIFVVLPAGQGYTASATDPALGKQMTKASTAQRANADCVLDKTFGPK